MKIKDIEKLKKARSIINFLMEGINPVDYSQVPKDSCLNDPTVIRMFSYIALVLTEDIKLETDKDEKTIKQLKEKDAAITPTYIDRNESYKSINDLIKSSKIEVFNKLSMSPELRKLASLIEKDEKSS